MIASLGYLNQQGKWQTKSFVMANGRQIFYSERCQNARSTVQGISDLN